MATVKKYQMDMCHGPLLGKIIRFAIPLMMANAMSLMFHAADLIVLGRFAKGEAMAAVGSAPGFTTLMLNLFWGISAGVNVLAARYTGAKDRKNLFRTVHTAIAVAILGGIGMAVLGLVITPSVLRIMAVPDAIMDKASLYVWIWCIGIPFMILFSFGSAILRAIGDTKRPLIFMIIAGVSNVVLNLLFVIVFKWDVAGVAIATKLSNLISAVLVLAALTGSRERYRLFWRRLGIHWSIVKEMFRIGLPAGVQGMLFSVSNILIQSRVNSFGWMAIAGNTAALSLEGIIHVAFSSFSLAVVSFVGQNHGAKKYKRIIKSIMLCLLCSGTTAVICTIVGLSFKRELLGIYNPDPSVIDYGVLRLNYQLTFYVLVALQEVIVGALRGLGYSLGPTIVSLLGACAFRIFWIYVIFPIDPRLENLMISYPISWALVSLFNGAMLIYICRRMLIKASNPQNLNQIQIH